MSQLPADQSRPADVLMSAESMARCKPRRIDAVTSRELEDGEFAVLSPSGEQLVVLNPMGGIVWQLCSGEHTIEQMARVISDAFAGVSFEQVLGDVVALVETLVRDGLLRA